MQDDRLSVAVVGAGYWGPNLVRNFNLSQHWHVAAVCDLDLERAERLALTTRSAVAVRSVEEALAIEGVDAIAIATPARTHEPIALAAIAAGKHVLTEKPLADSVGSGERMVAAAEAAGVVLMADHTFCYTPAVLKIAELIAEGELGDITFVDSVRINHGLVQPDVDVFWDLAPHDLSILDFILPDGLRPSAVSAHGGDPLGLGKACVGYLVMQLADGVIAHVHANWLSPTKIRQLVVGGTRRTLVWDDLNPTQRVSVYDRGIDFVTVTEDAERAAAQVSYRYGDTWVPALPEVEALSLMVGEFAAAIHEGRAPRTDGRAALRVLKVLDATSRSLEAHSAPATVGAEKEETIA
ncbi:Gfo/Idh/MocA family oxidoreductase [Microbacterium sp. CFH 31415]|jgi:predicted dehydrogenase|uniref:Gfo/Idh/MocA family protein n=1 Tax=unclassified Microbacterium TaxID=2609290 RepID=UPI001F137806|nr:Gfo/Idh/MocA family oxidoreductase [Microbacterium sp. CFH 31415]MCH6230755.1 Gfo/Idh/MocA family oxidoreductase [Microbacterium sp. CFH 31415]